jgi:tetratricopeptide (TPR) repeat protein
MAMPDGAHVVSGAADKTARIWTLLPSGQPLVEEVKHVAPRCLTPEQRRQFHLSPTPPDWCEADQKWPFDAVTLAKNALRAHQWREAIDGFQKAISLDQRRAAWLSPWLAASYNAAASSAVIETRLKGRGEEPLDQALADVEQAIKLLPHSSFFDTRGQIYLALGRADEAIADLDKAVADGSGGPDTLYALGRALELKGDVAAAITGYRRAVGAKADGKAYPQHAQNEARIRLQALGATAETDSAAAQPK